MYVAEINAQLHTELADMQGIALKNCGLKYFLTLIDVFTIGVNRAEIFGPAWPEKFLFRPGPARPSPQSMYYKIVTVHCFEILQQNKYNYIQLHSYFPLV